MRARSDCRSDNMAELRSDGRLQRQLEQRFIDRFLKHGDPQHGFARVYRPECRHDYLLAFSCKARYFCPSCHQKRVLAHGDWVEENMLAPVAQRQYVFTVPRMLRPIFSRRRGLPGALCRIVEQLLTQAYSGAGVAFAHGIAARRLAPPASRPD